MWLPHVSFLGLIAQFPLHSFPPAPLAEPGVSAVAAPVRHAKFELKDGHDRFTPRDAIELARPGQGVANPAGDFVFVPVSKYSSTEDMNAHTLFFASLASTVPPFEVPLPKGAEAFWLDNSTVGAVFANDDGATSSLHTISLSPSSTNFAAQLPIALGTFPTRSVANFRYSPGSGLLVFSDNVYSDGNLTNVQKHDEEWEHRGSTALVYDEANERFWDTWKGPKKSSLFTMKLWKDSEEKWHFGKEFVNVLNGTGHHTPVGHFGGKGDFDVSNHYIVYTTPDPSLPEVSKIKQNIYIIDVENSAGPKELTSGKQAGTLNPVFSPAGDKVAWLERENDSSSANNTKIIVYDLTKDVRFMLAESWDRSPDSLAFSPDSSWLYLTAGDHARTLIFKLPVPPTPATSTAHDSTPRPLTSSGSASGLQVLLNDRLLFTHSTLERPNDVFVLHGINEKHGTPSAERSEQITRLSEKALEGKDLAAHEDFWFKGAEGKTVHGYVLKPKGWKAGQKKRYPVVLLIHGGPQSVWEDGWSTRWNLNVFAQQGYFVVAINPTGSTTYGQEFTDAITQDWGGKPFVDLVNGWKHVLNKYPEIDADRAVAAGASWGGYAVNWIQGHPEFGFNFKALVCHDGIFDLGYGVYASDVAFFFSHEWGGLAWEPAVKERISKNSPHEFVGKWATPMLVVHGSKDYRLPETEGIAAFHALRQRGVPSRLVVFPDENHWVLGHANSLKWHYEVFRWFDLYVGGGAGGEDSEASDSS